MVVVTDTQRGRRAAFDRQATDRNMERVWQHAHSLVRQVGARAGRQGPTSADDLVQAALVGTLEGRLVWDPARVDLPMHLMNAVSNIVRNELRRARRFPEVSLEDERHDPDQLDHEVTTELAASRGTNDQLETRQRLAVWVAQLRVIAGSDRGVGQILDAFDHGAFDRHDIMSLTSMSERTYHNAHQRMVRLAKKMTTDADGITQGVADDAK